jgi:hypothetical protein
MGTVFNADTTAAHAYTEFETWCEISKTGRTVTGTSVGAAHGECVALFEGPELIREYDGHLYASDRE